MPKIVDKGAKKREIALAAFDLFAEKGIQHTTVAEAAKAAGVAKGTIYLYFANKEEIVLEIWEEFHEGHEHWLEGRSSIPRSEAEKIFDHLYMGHYEHEMLCKAFSLYGDYLVSIVIGRNPIFIQHAVEKFDKTVQQVEIYLKQGIAAGEFREGIDTTNFAAALVQLREGCLTSATARGLDVDYLTHMIPTTLKTLLQTITKTQGEKP